MPFLSATTGLLGPWIVLYIFCFVARIEDFLLFCIKEILR